MDKKTRATNSIGEFITYGLSSGKMTHFLWMLKTYQFDHKCSAMFR